MSRSTITRGVAALLVMALLAVFGFLLTFQIANAQKEDYFKQRMIQVKTAAAALDDRDVAALSGSPADLGTPPYEKLLSQLIRIKKSDAGIRFVYLMRPLADKMIFLVDAENPSSPDYSPPGQVYEDASSEDFLPFEDKARQDAIITGPLTDSYGQWISATAVITDSSGRAVASLGTDVEVDKALRSFNEVKRLGVILNLLAVGLLGLVFAQYVFWLHGKDRRNRLRLEMEESVKQLNDELVKTDEMKSEFIQLASHELRNPVNAMSVSINALEAGDRQGWSEEQRACVDVARKGVRRLIELVNDLLDTTLLDADEFLFKIRQVDAGRLVLDTAQLFKGLADEKGLMLRTRVPDNPVKARLDPGVTLRILENLVGNAINYTEFGTVEIALEPGFDTLRFEVSDTGPGIPEEFREEIFVKFSKMDRERARRTDGCGIGLALCKSMVEAQGGRIWCESRAGGGSVFIFEVPREQGDRKGGES